MQHLQAHHQAPTSRAHARLATYRARHDDAESRGDLAGRHAQALVRLHDQGQPPGMAGPGGPTASGGRAPPGDRAAGTVRGAGALLVPEPLPAPLDARQALPLDLAVPAGRASDRRGSVGPGHGHGGCATGGVGPHASWRRHPAAAGTATTEVPGAAYILAGLDLIGGKDRRFRTTLERRRSGWSPSGRAASGDQPALPRPACACPGREDEAAPMSPVPGAESNPVYGRMPRVDTSSCRMRTGTLGSGLAGDSGPMGGRAAFADWWSRRLGTWRLPTERVARGRRDGWPALPMGRPRSITMRTHGTASPAPCFGKGRGLPTDASTHGVAGGSGGVGTGADPLDDWTAGEC